MADENTGQDIVSLAKELDEKRVALRESQAEANKIPHLNAEIEHLQSDLEKERAERKAGSEREADLDRRVRELESELRSQNELEAEVAHAKEDADAAEEARAQHDEERAAAEARAGEAETKVADLQARVDELSEKAGHLDHLVELGVVKGIS